MHRTVFIDRIFAVPELANAIDHSFAHVTDTLYVTDTDLIVDIATGITMYASTTFVGVTWLNTPFTNVFKCPITGELFTVTIPHSDGQLQIYSPSCYRYMDLHMDIRDIRNTMQIYPYRVVHAMQVDKNTTMVIMTLGVWVIVIKLRYHNN